jgi:hypothetical protein
LYRFEERFESGVHFEPVRYDLADLLPRGQQLIENFKSGGWNSTEMQRMAAAAGSKAQEVFNILGQLDALTYAVLEVRDLELQSMYESSISARIGNNVCVSRAHILTLVTLVQPI